ncbi:uncharacterized protein [Aristolochia californica]|uniref:uncharacterized protein n=1 Tax=Aristolochia californica TaxID=171875 RepID=UPI0035D9B707
MEPPPAALNLRTTRQIIRQSSVSFLSNLHIFLFLALLLFSFRNAVDGGTLFLTSFIERDPSVQALISRLSADPPRQLLATKASNLPESVRSTAAWNHNRHHRRRRPFLHLSRVGTLDDDFFSDDIDDDRSLFAFSHQGKYRSNGSFIRFAPFMPPGKVDGFRVLEIGGPGFVFFADDDVGESNNPDDEDRRLDLRLFGRGFNLDRHESATLLYLVSLLTAAYGGIILGFFFTYCFVYGTVFLAVVNSILQRYPSAIITIRDGCRLGLRRLLGFVLLRWAVRDALTQFLGIWFFSDIHDQHSLFKLFVRLKLMPFSVASSSPWTGPSGFNTDISGFLFTWVISDMFISLVFAVNCWVAIMDIRRGGQDILREGCYLISIMVKHAIRIKWFESIFCGSLVRMGLSQVGGNLFAMFFQSVAEVYFMVVWLVFYFSARAKEAESDGRRFGRRELEDSISSVR